VGLDQYAFAVHPHPDNTDFYIGWDNSERYDGKDIQENMCRFAVWRKHPNLQGWMEKLFNHKANMQNYRGEVKPGGMGDDIGFTSIVLDPETGEEQEMTDEIREALAGLQKEINENMPDALRQSLLSAPAQRVFNCQPIRLTLSDLEQLETAINRGHLPATSGFFFGDSADDENKEYDLEFITASREAIKNGLDVYYNSWW